MLIFKFINLRADLLKNIHTHRMIISKYVHISTPLFSDIFREVLESERLDQYAQSFKDSKKDLKIPKPVSSTSRSTETRFLSTRAEYKRRVRACSKNFEILQRDFFVGAVDAVVVLVIATSALIRPRESSVPSLHRRWERLRSAGGRRIGS